MYMLVNLHSKLIYAFGYCRVVVIILKLLYYSAPPCTLSLRTQQARGRKCKRLGNTLAVSLSTLHNHPCWLFITFTLGTVAACEFIGARAMSFFTLQINHFSKNDTNSLTSVGRNCWVPVIVFLSWLLTETANWTITFYGALNGSFVQHISSSRAICSLGNIRRPFVSILCCVVFVRVYFFTIMHDDINNRRMCWHLNWSSKSWKLEILRIS